MFGMDALRRLVVALVPAFAVQADVDFARSRSITRGISRVILDAPSVMIEYLHELFQ